MDEAEHRRRRVRPARTEDEAAAAAAPEAARDAATEPATADAEDRGTVSRRRVRDRADRATRTERIGQAERVAPPRPPADRPDRGDRDTHHGDTHHGHGHGREDHERGLRGLVGAGSSQVSISAAMRARDAARPTDQEIATAEATLAIVHRGWVPRDST